MKDGVREEERQKEGKFQARLAQGHLHAGGPSSTWVPAATGAGVVSCKYVGERVCCHIVLADWRLLPERCHTPRFFFGRETGDRRNLSVFDLQSETCLMTYTLTLGFHQTLS